MPPRSTENESPVRLRVLDVRPVLARKEHPVEEVLAAARALADDGVLEIIAPFEPRPLMRKLEAQGCVVAASEKEGVFSVRVGKRPLPALLDVSEREPPEPMERTLDAAVALAPGEVLLALVPRVPRMLLPELEGRGLTVAVAERPDGTALLWVKR